MTRLQADGASLGTSRADQERPHPLDLNTNAASEESNGYSNLDDNGSDFPTSNRSSPFSIQIPAALSLPDTAFTALQYLPMPVLVLSSLKTVILANEAMARLLYGDSDRLEEEGISQAGTAFKRDLFHGQTLSQLGVDMVQNGTPVWVNWEVSTWPPPGDLLLAVAFSTSKAS